MTQDLRHHNTLFPGDTSILEKEVEKNNARHVQTFLDVQQTLENGNIVEVHSNVRLTEDGPGFEAVHIFHFAGDRIVEMLDTVITVPEDFPADKEAVLI